MERKDIKLKFSETGIDVQQNEKLKSGKKVNLHEITSNNKMVRKIQYDFIDINIQKKYLLTELKASMRFWFRAFNVLDLKTLWEVEGILFGNSEKNKSPVNLKLNKEIKIEDGSIDLCILLKPYVQEEFRSLNNNSNEDNKDKCIEKAFGKKSGTSKEIIKKALNIVLDSNGIKWYESLLELSIILGGIGKNSRKNQGNFIFNTCKDEQEFMGKIKKLINTIRLTKENKEIVSNNITKNKYDYESLKNESGTIEAGKYNYSYVLKILFSKEKYDKKTCNLKNGPILMVEEISAKNWYGKAPMIPSPVYYSSYIVGDEIIYIISLLNKVVKEGKDGK